MSMQLQWQSGHRRLGTYVTELPLHPTPNQWSPQGWPTVHPVLTVHRGPLVAWYMSTSACLSVLDALPTSS